MKRFLAILSAIMVLTMAMVTTCFAAEVTMYDYNGTQLAEFPYYDADNYPYLMLYKSGSTMGYNIIASATDYYVNDNGLVNYTETGKHLLYSYSNGAWVQAGGEISHYSDGGTGLDVNKTLTQYPIWTAQPLYKKSGDTYLTGDPNFFPLPELMQMVTEKTLMDQTVPEILQTIQKLIPMAVGLMALLIGLPLLSKVLLRFLT